MERRFQYVGGFQDETEVLGFRDDGSVVGYMSDGTTEDMSDAYDLASAERNVREGVWEELSSVP